MTTKLDIAVSFQAREILSASEAPGTDTDLARTLRSDAFDASVAYDANSTPAVSGGPVVQEITIGGSPTVIDLSSAPRLAGLTGDMSTKRVVAFMLKAGAGNAGDVTVAPHSTNGYDIGGSANGLIVKPGQRTMVWFEGVASALDAVNSNDENIAISGTSGDTIDVIFVLGT